MELASTIKEGTFVHRAKLVEHEVVPVEDLMEWAKWFETGERHVRVTILSHRRRIWVSTVFLGLNHGWFGIPLWFETMIFGTSIDGAQDRYTTWDEALRGHEKMVRRARQARQVRHVPVSMKNVRRRFRK